MKKQRSRCAVSVVTSKLKSHIICFTLTFAVLLSALFIAPTAAFADTGPKPSVRISFQNMGNELCYGTLLSEYSSTGPSSAWDGVSPYTHYEYGEEGYPVWEAFVKYEDSDGFYFLQEWWECSETKNLNWTYYPPDRFKILLYYPNSDTFSVSEIYERYSFDSYFTVDMNASQSVLYAQESYDYTWESISLICRIVITILLEIAVAYCLGFREKRLISLIAAVNLLTQSVLNIALNLVNYMQGYQAFVFKYVIFEFAVFLIEAFIYARLFPKFSNSELNKKRIIIYALAANVVSFAGGMFIAKAVPGIF